MAVSRAFRETIRSIRLVVSDIDGTLVTDEKRITPQTQEAVQALNEAHIPLCLVSSRPPIGMTRFITQLGNKNPYAGYNGALIVDHSDQTLSHLVLDSDCVREIVELLNAHHIQVWIFQGRKWYVSGEERAFQDEEEATISITPIQVSVWKKSHFEGVEKMMAVSADITLLSHIEKKLHELFSNDVSIAHSMPHYIDMTHRSAHKGYAAQKLAELMNISIEEVACLGDMNNDIPMMKVVGCAIAMGNASDHVKKHAHYITATNEEEGWAQAIHNYILPSK